MRPPPTSRPEYGRLKRGRQASRPARFAVVRCPRAPEGHCLTPLLGAATLFDRASERRADPSYVAALAEAPQARFLLLVGGKAAIASNPERSSARVRWFAKTELEAFGVGTSDALLLGTEGGM